MRSMKYFGGLLLLSFACLAASGARADMPSLQSGNPADASTDGGVNTLSGQLFVSLALPISSPQRGGKLNFNFALTANSVPWSVKYLTKSTSPSSCVAGANACAWTDSLGRTQTIGNITGGVGLARSWDISLHRNTFTETIGNNDGTDTSEDEYNHYLLTSDGAVHHLQDVSGGSLSHYVAIDGSGYQVFQSNPDSYGVYQSAVIIDRQGNQFTATWGTGGTGSCTSTFSKSGAPPFVTTTSTRLCDSFTATSKVTDVNGNVYTLVGVGGGAGLDTKGVTPPTEVVAGAANSAACQSVAGLPIASTSTFGYAGYKGTVPTFTECFANYTLQTGFAQPGVSEFPATTKSLLVTAVMPDGTKYTFDYDAYGNLSYIGLPLGGNIRYTWETVSFGISGCGNAAQMSRAVQSRTVNDNNGHSYVTNYSWGTLQPNGTLTNTVTDATGNDTVHVFSIFANANAGSVSGTTSCQGLVETSTQNYRGTGVGRTLLTQSDVNYSAAALPAEQTSDFENSPFIGNVFANTVTTTDVSANRVKRLVRTPDIGLGAGKPFFGEVVREQTYDWGQGGPGPLLQQTDVTYLWQNDSRYLTAGILNLPAAVVVKDGSGNRVAETDYTYDGSINLTASGITAQHGPAPNPVRGNITTIASWLNTRPASPVTKPFDFYDTGERIDDIQPGNWSFDHRTEFRYDSTGTYVTEVDMPSTNNSVMTGLPTVAHVIKTQQDFNTGFVTSTTDQNGNVTTFDYDNMGRRLHQTNSDGGQVAYNYNAFGAVISNLNTAWFPGTIDSTSNLSTLARITDTDVTYDGLGRSVRTRKLLSSTGSGTSANYVRATTDTTYDAFGRLLTVTNPYINTTDATYGVTQSQYDALGRVINVMEADSSTVTNTYDLTVPGIAGLCSRTRDEAGKSREACTDALGRLTAVFEDPAGLDLETDYGYATTANGGQMITITQKGRSGNPSGIYRVHTSLYDSLGRLLSATNPETGTIGYGYDDNGNVSSKSDARGVTTNYTYDQGNRLELLSFSNAPAGTANSCWVYDVSSFPGMGVFANPVGRMVVSSEGCGTMFHGYSYDSIGRVTSHLQCAGDANMSPTNCASQAVAYDYLGDMTSLQYQNGYQLNYTYDQAGRPLSVTDGNGYVFANNLTYAANGLVTSIPTPTFSYNYVYNTRFQLSQVAIGSTAASLLVKDYDYRPGSDDGDVYSVTDENDARRSQAFAYDTVNRLTCAQAGVTSLGSTCTGTGAWGDSYSYDDFGNLTAKNSTQGVGEQIAMTVDDATNRIVTAAGKTYAYDSAGNIINDGTRAYTFDGSDRLLSAGNMHYTYGPGGERITKSDGTTYYYGPGGQLLTTFNPDGSRSNYVYLGATRLARIQWAGSNSAATSDIKYYLSDALGSTDKFVDKDGKTILADQDFFPFGGIVPGIGTASNSNHFLFTAQERDPESGLDYFGARYYNNVLGRFMSADWNGGAVAIPYASVGDPQSLDLYSYVRNNPTSLVDADGHGYAGFNGFMAGGGGGGEPTEESTAVAFSLGIWYTDTIEIVDLTDQIHRPDVIPDAASEEPDPEVPDLNVPAESGAIDGTDDTDGTDSSCFDCRYIVGGSAADDDPSKEPTSTQVWYSGCYDASQHCSGDVINGYVPTVLHIAVNRTIISDEAASTFSAAAGTGNDIAIALIAVTAGNVGLMGGVPTISSRVLAGGKLVWDVGVAFWPLAWRTFSLAELIAGENPVQALSDLYEKK